MDDFLDLSKSTFTKKFKYLIVFCNLPFLLVNHVVHIDIESLVNGTRLFQNRSIALRSWFHTIGRLQYLFLWSHFINRQRGSRLAFTSLLCFLFFLLRSVWIMGAFMSFPRGSFLFVFTFSFLHSFCLRDGWIVCCTCNTCLDIQESLLF